MVDKFKFGENPGFVTKQGDHLKLDWAAVVGPNLGRHAAARKKGNQESQRQGYRYHDGETRFIHRNYDVNYAALFFTWFQTQNIYFRYEHDKRFRSYQA